MDEKNNEFISISYEEFHRLVKRKLYLRGQMHTAGPLLLPHLKIAEKQIIDRFEGAYIPHSYFERYANEEKTIG